MTALTVIILTHNEAAHIQRAIGSVAAAANRVIVVDSFSTDATCDLARAAGAEVLQNTWVNYATQFNWALDQVSDAPGWVLRLDADEYLEADLTPALAAVPPEVQGLFIDRYMHFMGQPIRHGGLFPAPMLRLFRNGAGRCENRWMDEHIMVSGPTARLPGRIVDDNRKPLDWWIAKHNSYASREAVDVLNQTFAFMPMDSIASADGSQASIKRWIKEKIYNRLPAGARAGAYFFYRYVLRLGFLDGPEARAFHVLQGFWYRYLVDAKLRDVRAQMRQRNLTPVQAIRDVLGITIPQHHPNQRKAAA
ncbi:glycosyltransferase family 2 protein [Yoonia sp. SS1-5]|uniref:Glycosyltransferase family 2 protein n=1 Tax=Yoonia rhodophyticola TaxID=3137370 RepID=A0AAN0NLJ9_9RHOB